MGTSISGISYQLRGIQMYTPYVGGAGMLLYMNGKFTMGKLKSFLCRQVSFLTAHHCQLQHCNLAGTFKTYIYIPHQCQVYHQVQVSGNGI